MKTDGMNTGDTTTYVFLGPSLPREEAARLLDATFLPPIQQGDLLRLLARGPRHVGIVDGYFETVPAVWHKEILLALERGVHVFGAASMGALRAAELHSFGMVGVGAIFEGFRDGTLIDDDEVAVLHGPAELGYPPITQALVDIRDGCAVALRDGVIGADCADAIVAAARALAYQERTYAAIAAALRDGGQIELRQVEAWLDYVATRHDSLKARDAASLLVAMKGRIAEPWVPKRIDFVPERTIFIERLLNEVTLDGLRQDAGAAAARTPPIDAPPIEELRRDALLRLAARDAARRFGWELSTDELREEAGQLCAGIGLTDPEAVRDWLAAESLSEPAFWSHVGDALFVRRLIRHFQPDLDRALPDQLRMMRALARRGAQPQGSASDDPDAA